MLDPSQIAFTIAIATVILLFYLTYTILFKKPDEATDEQKDDSTEANGNELYRLLDFSIFDNLHLI